MKFTHLIFSGLTLLAPAVSSSSTPSGASSCLATKEFVTTLEFLRRDPDFKIKDPEAKDLAFQVANGCEGAAKRFIRVSKTLTSAGATNRSAIQNALPFAQSSDVRADAFIQMFRKSIAEDSLDLEMDDALKIASELSTQPQEATLSALARDFERLAEYCSDSQNLGLPRSQCGAFAARVSKKGESQPTGIAKTFIQMVEYLKSESGPNLTTGDALNMAEALVAQGQPGLENFKQAYQYGSSAKGLSLSRVDAIHFAKKMSQITKIEEKAAVPAKK